MSSLLDNVKQLLNLGVGDIGRLEHIKSSLEENKKLYSSDMNYVEKMIEQHIGNQEIIEQVPEIKSEQVKDSIIVEPVNIIQPSKNIGIFNKTEKKSEGKKTQSKLKVSVGWQIFFIFVPIVGIWAYYRIKRLGDGLLLSGGLAFLLFGGMILIFLVGGVTDPNFESDLTVKLEALALWPVIGIMIWLKIRYMIKWSREWNKKIDTRMESISKEEPHQD